MPKMKQTKANKARAKRMAKILDEYDIKSEGDCAVTDALTDLRHLCDLKGWDFFQSDRLARDHYAAELGGE